MSGVLPLKLPLGKFVLGRLPRLACRLFRLLLERPPVFIPRPPPRAVIVVWIVEALLLTVPATDSVMLQAKADVVWSSPGVRTVVGS
jgi:hypothetical protein